MKEKSNKSKINFFYFPFKNLKFEKDKNTERMNINVFKSRVQNKNENVLLLPMYNNNRQFDDDEFFY